MKRLTEKIRKTETWQAYDEYKKTEEFKDFNFSNVGSLKEWKYWRLIINSFPHNKYATKHTMLVPKRIFGELVDTTAQEFQELNEIKRELGEEYDFFLNPAHTKVDLCLNITISTAL